MFDSGDEYDGLDRFNRVVKSRWAQGSTDLYNVALTYDRNSNPTTLDDSVQTGFDWKYTYDMLDRLAEAQAGTLSGGNITSEQRKQPFDLDQAGNWTHTDLVTGGSTTEYDWDFTHNKVNEITGWDNQTNNVTPTYDASGNMTDDKRDWKYEYDAWYRLVKVRDQSNNVKAEFKYNGIGYRIASRYDETSPWYYFAYDDRWRQVAMYEDSDTDPTEQFWYQNAGMSGFGGSSYIDDVILRDRDTDSNGTLDERRYYLQNWHHDVVALMDTSGSLSERINYDAYGSPIGRFTGIANRKGYAGYEYDVNLSVNDSHTYHIRRQLYRSDLGVWTTERASTGSRRKVTLICWSDVSTRRCMCSDPGGLFLFSDEEICDAWRRGCDPSFAGAVTCSPKLDPIAVRVSTALFTGKEALEDETQTTHTRTDHRQAA